MKNFIIILKNNKTSEFYGNNAIESGKRYNWILERFNAVNGKEVSLADYNLKPTDSSKKCNSAFNRLGVVGCFLSHYNLWIKCLELNEPIGIFEHDVLFQKSFSNNIKFNEVLRLDQLTKGKEHGTGDWWEGSHAYFITPIGAKKLVDWANQYGAWPSDVMIGTKVVKIEFDNNIMIALDNSSKQVSSTKNNF
jgi:GR25 family glycosyltransferase involved in LPS biosynthesis